MQKIKSNLSKVACSQLNLSPPFWARGYLGRSVGKISTQNVKRYLEVQAEHHGYAERLHAPVFRYRDTHPKILKSSHTAFDLKHHLVFATRWRRGVFDSVSGPALTNYWLKVADKHGFAIDQI